MTRSAELAADLIHELAIDPITVQRDRAETCLGRKDRVQLLCEHEERKPGTGTTIEISLSLPEPLLLECITEEFGTC
jgi:hypothetical protein